VRYGTPIEPQTGLYAPVGSKRAGIFIRESDAVVFVADLRKAMRHYDGPQTCEAKVFELIELLERVKQ